MAAETRSDVAARLGSVRRRIRDAATRAGRDPEAITLVAVSKGFSADLVREAARAGQINFGENWVQEARGKIPAVGEAGLAGLRWHMVGHLQTNKVRWALELFDIIESVDSLRLAEAINAQAERIGKAVPILLEVNMAGEATKFGFLAVELDVVLDRLVDLRGLEVQGFMTIAPLNAPPEVCRVLFRALRQNVEGLAARHPRLPLRHLSMGMTDDFEVAVEEGSTMVRIGRAIFGERA